VPGTVAAMEAWTRLVRALGPASGELALRAPATETDLVATEVMVGHKLPPEYRAWLSVANGQETTGLSILPRGGWLISHDRLIEQWTHERGFDLDAEDYDAAPGEDDELVRPFVFHPRRLTIGGWHFLDGDNTLIDLIPGPAGTEGQVMTFVTECDFEVIGASFGALIESIAQLVERGTLSPLMVDDALRLTTPDGAWSWEHLLR
jgi:cell wall assembly regulator SMI1